MDKNPMFCYQCEQKAVADLLALLYLGIKGVF